MGLAGIRPTHVVSGRGHSIKPLEQPGGAVKQSTTQLAYVRPDGAQTALSVPPESESNSLSLLATPAASERRPINRGYGIEVHEDELGSATAQRLYRLRCQCGRAWFELELPKLVQCPACLRLNVVTILGVDAA